MAIFAADIVGVASDELFKCFKPSDGCDLASNARDVCCLTRAVRAAARLDYKCHCVVIWWQVNLNSANTGGVCAKNKNQLPNGLPKVGSGVYSNQRRFLLDPQTSQMRIQIETHSTVSAFK